MGLFIVVVLLCVKNSLSPYKKMFPVKILVKLMKHCYFCSVINAGMINETLIQLESLNCQPLQCLHNFLS